jgi:hypothetical protein
MQSTVLTEEQRAKIQSRVMAAPPMSDGEIERVALILAAAKADRRRADRASR